MKHCIFPLLALLLGGSIVAQAQNKTFRQSLGEKVSYLVVEGNNDISIIAGDSNTLSIEGSKPQRVATLKGDTLFVCADSATTSITLKPNSLAGFATKNRTTPISIDPQVLDMWTRDATDSVQKIDWYKRYPAAERIGAEWHWGWTQWGEHSYSSALGNMEEAYSSKLHFGTWGVNLSYAFIRRPRWRLEAGLGLELHSVKLHNSYVYLPNGQSDLATANADTIASMENMTGALANPAVWETHFKANYCYIPLRLTFSPAKGLDMGISLKPGIGLRMMNLWGLTHIISKDDVGGLSVVHSSSHANSKKIVNPLELNLRLDLIYNGIGFYFETGLLPMAKGLEKSPHLFSFGFILRMYNY